MIIIRGIPGHSFIIYYLLKPNYLHYLSVNFFNATLNVIISLSKTVPPFETINKYITKKLILKFWLHKENQLPQRILTLGFVATYVYWNQSSLNLVKNKQSLTKPPALAFTLMNELERKRARVRNNSEQTQREIDALFFSRCDMRSHRVTRGISFIKLARLK